MEQQILDQIVEASVEVHRLVIIEVKATGKDYPIYRAQLLTYLRLPNTKMGILVDFGRPVLKEGVCVVSNM